MVQRDNGLYTYFASDIAYHVNKFERGFDRVIDIWGADHHGYIPRVKGALAALEIDADRLDVALVQFVSLFRDGAKVSMSTRAGNYVTLRELREEVGNDACRFFYLLRKQDQALDFDLDLAKSRVERQSGLLRAVRPCPHLLGAGPMGRTRRRSWPAPTCRRWPASANWRCAAGCRSFPELIAQAARDSAPHALAFYLRELAGEFHGWYNAERLLVDDDALKRARLALAVAVRQVLRNGLRILGVSAPEAM